MDRQGWWQVDVRIADPDEMSLIGSWLPQLFCGQAGRIAGQAASSCRLGDVADACLEGWRVSADPQSVLYEPLANEIPRYRQANIGVFFLDIETEHCERPMIEDRPFCVFPGDVIVPRIPPLHACLVSDSNSRHPIDGNCFLIRGMKPVDAAWLLALLNEEEFEAWFVARSNSQVLPRIGLRDLRNCPFPDPPAGIYGWSRRLLDWIENYANNASRLFALMTEVSRCVSKYFADQEDYGNRLFPGVREPATVLSADSWLPAHVENANQQKRLLEQGASRLKELVTAEEQAAHRLKEDPDTAVHILRIVDVSGVFISSVDWSFSQTRKGRFYAEPIRQGEVLISSLVSKPKIAYAAPGLSEEIHPIDHWIRLRFRETPGAWAMVLSSPAMDAQYKRLAMGSALQFTNASRMLDIRVPEIDIAQRSRWQARIDAIMADRRALDKEWKTLRLAGRQMVAAVLDIPLREIQDRSLK